MMDQLREMRDLAARIERGNAPVEVSDDDMEDDLISPPPPPPPPFEPNEDMADRQQRLHPDRPPVVRYDGMEDACAICLEAYNPREKVVRLQCNHSFHEECWADHVQSYVTNPQYRRHGDPDEPTCGICRAPGYITAIFPWVGTPHDPVQSAREIRELREQLEHLTSNLQRGNTPGQGSADEVRPPMETGYVDRLIDPAEPSLYVPGHGQVSHHDPPEPVFRGAASPQDAGGSAEMRLNPDELRQQRLRHFQSPGGHTTTLMLRESIPMTPIEERSVATSAASSEFPTNNEVNDWLRYDEWRTSRGYTPISLERYVDVVRHPLCTDSGNYLDEYERWADEHEEYYTSIAHDRQVYPGEDTDRPSLYDYLTVRMREPNDQPYIPPITGSMMKREWICLSRPSRTFLPNDRLSILVDIGSRINIIGENVAKKFATRAIENGRLHSLEDRSMLHVNGVGSGSAPVEKIGHYGIACKYQQGAQDDDYKSNIVGGSGKDLPAILGLDSMQEKRTIIILERGKERMIFPGPGAVQLKLPEGSKLTDLTTLPSGHLAIESDHYNKVPAGKPATGSTTSFTTVISGTDPDTPEQEPEHGNVPPALIRVMAKAALHGHALTDLETSDAFLAKVSLETGLTRDEVHKRKTIITTYKSEELQLVTKAREDGTLDKLMSDVHFLGKHVGAEADEVLSHLKEAIKQHDELVMLESLYTEAAPSCQPCAPPSHLRGTSSSD